MEEYNSEFYFKPIPLKDDEKYQGLMDCLEDDIKFITIEVVDRTHNAICCFDFNNEPCSVICKEEKKNEMPEWIVEIHNSEKKLYSKLKKEIKKTKIKFSNYGIFISRIPIEGVVPGSASKIGFFTARIPQSIINKSKDISKSKPINVLKDEDGYYYLILDGKKYFYHEVIWSSYHKKEPKGEIIHLDGNKENNSIENLIDSGDDN